MCKRHLRSPWRLRPGLLLAAGLLALVSAPAEAASPPVQPKTGPGSPIDPTGEVVKRAVGRASAATYVYHLATEPSEPRTVVVLLHAWGAVNPLVYGGWIDHLARRGHLVLFPAFQTVGRTRPVDASAEAATLVKDALAALDSDTRARPDRSRLIYLGHSAGAAIGLNLAATATNAELPKPKLVFGVMPGGIASDAKSRGVQLADLGGLDPGTSLVMMVGDREFQAADKASRRILRDSAPVPVARKLFVRSASDDHGFPALSATLASPASPKEGYDMASIKLPPDPPVDPKAPRVARPKWTPDVVLSGEQTVLLGQLQRNVTDALDYMAYWRTFDMAAAAALSSKDMASVRADPSLVDMGRWSDGWPVRRLTAEVPKAAEPAAMGATPVATRAPAAATPIQSKQPVTRRRETRQGR